VLYTAPIEYAFSRALPLLKKRAAADPGDGDRRRRPAPGGRVDEADRARARHRRGSTESALFEDPATLDELVEVSGGHVRTMFGSSARESNAATSSRR